MAITIALATALSNLKAQNIIIEHNDSILCYLDKSQITSNILVDRIDNYSAFAYFNNAIDTTDYDYAMQVYTDLFSANYRNTQMTKPIKLMHTMELQNLKNIVPVQVLDYDYQQIKPTAWQDGLLRIDNYQLLNAVGNPNIYLNKTLHLTTLMSQKIDATTFTLLLAPNFISRNTGVNVNSVSIQGNGINVVLNGPVDSATITVPTAGNYFVNVTTTLNNGLVYTTKNKLTIGDPPLNAAAQNYRFVPKPACYSTQFFGTIPWQGYDETQPFLGKFDLDIYYRNGILCEVGPQALKSPVILIDGFDPIDKRNTKNKQLYSKFLKYFDDETSPNSPIEIDFVQDIRDRGKDVILVDIPTYWVQYASNQIIPLDSNATNPPPGYTLADGKIIRGGGDYVERNAMTMVSLLLDIQAKLDAAGSTDSIVLIGPSMGGQITRYALKYMEDRGIPHRVRLWISQDSNHDGAVVPIGEQLAIATNANLGDQKSIETLERQLNAPAAKQFIINHYKFNITDYTNINLLTEEVGGAPNFKNRYTNAIDSIGWPTLFRKISTISGAENGMPLNIPQAGELAMAVRVPVRNQSFFFQNLCDFIDGGGCYGATIEMYTAPKPNISAKTMYFYKFVFDIGFNHWTIKKINKTFYTIGDRTKTNEQSVEVVQSGYYWGYSEFENTILQTKPKTGEWQIENKSRYHAFQPTGSTLAYGKGANPNVYGFQFKWDDDVTRYNLSCDKYIPFDYYMGPEYFSVLHDSIFYPQALVLIDEIRGIKHVRPQPEIKLLISKYNFTKKYWCPGDTLYFSATSWYPGNIVPNWYVGTDELSIVSGQGTALVGVVYNGGYVNVSGGVNGMYVGINGGQSNCYTFIGANNLNMQPGDAWGGTIKSITPYVVNNFINFNYNPNFSNAARIKVVAGLAFRPLLPLEQYTLLSVISRSPIVYPYTWSQNVEQVKNSLRNILNITSGPDNTFIFKVTDQNVCYNAASPGENNIKIIFTADPFFVFKVGPIPASSTIKVERIRDNVYRREAEPAVITFTISNIINRQKIYNKTMANTGNIFNIPVDNITDGDYILEITCVKTLVAEKIIIRK